MTGPNREKLITMTVDDAFHLAQSLHKAHSLNEAEYLYRSILEVSPQALDPLHYLGLLCHQQKRVDEATALITRIVALDPANADAHNNLGNLYESIGDDGKAEECFRKAIELNPAHGPAHNNLGVILAEQNLLDEAIVVYLEAVRLSPDSGEFHYNLGNALRRKGDAEEAIAAYREATRLNPDHFGAWQGLARVLRVEGRKDEAVAVFDNLLRMHPGNPVFSYLRSACIGSDAPERAPDAYVQQIFDDSAEYFDKHLEALDYRAPQLLMEALSSLLRNPSSSLSILDAGCGTGLCGALLRPYAARLVGVDISEGMLGKAAERDIYHELFKAELTRFMEGHPHAFDLIISADTLCYFGELAPVLAAAKSALRSGGVLAFTLEDAGESVKDISLNSSGRYSHSRSYLESTLADSGLNTVSLTPVVLRNEGRQPVSGLLVIARKWRSRPGRQPLTQNDACSPAGSGSEFTSHR